MPSHTDPIAQLGKLEKAASEIKLQRQTRRAIASEIVPRATVAAALRELRDMWRNRSQMLVITEEDEAMFNTLSHVLDELDATIAKLGLEEPK